MTNQNTLSGNLYDVFISYGRNESKGFATRLNQALEQRGYRVWFDQDDIELAVDFQKRIDEGISQAHNFVFLIAPHAIRSAYCRKEIEVALMYNKRIIPVLHVERELDQLHPWVAERNWLYMREKEDPALPQNQWAAIDDFERGIAQMVELLEKDKGVVEQHTRLLRDALTWDKYHRSPMYLPVGKDREAAERWLKSTLGDFAPCLPSQLHCEYIAEARKNGENMMTDVFFTYDQRDQVMRQRINLALLRHGFTTWVDQSDIKAGVAFEEAIFEGIEQASNLIFLISNQSVQSDFCLKELQHALSLNKRVIPILIEKVPANELPEALRHIQYIDFTDNDEQRVLKSKKDKSDFQRDMDELIVQLHRDEEYILKHKQFLVQSLKWDKFDRNDSILLRGFNLEEAESWLKAGLKRREYRPTELQRLLIEASKAKVGQLKTEVFVSYSRKDADFARKLNNKLQVYGKTTWFDQESIAEGADFEKEIFKGIESSDNFLFIISPDSIASEYCEREVRFAEEHSKRFVPVLCRYTDPATLPAALGKVQWIDFEGKDFETTFGKLIFTLDTDRGYVQSHTQWQRQASEWESRNKSEDLLLRGNELVLAHSWLKSALEEQKMPAPTPLHHRYIEASEQARLLLIQREDERKAELARIRQEKREEEIKRLEKERASKRQRILIFILLFLFIAAVWLGFFGYEKSQEAAQLTQKAEQAEQLAKQSQIEVERQKKAGYDQLKAAEATLEQVTEETLKQRQRADSIESLALQQLNISQLDRLSLAESEKQRAIQQAIADQCGKEVENRQRKIEEQIQRAQQAAVTLPQVSYMAEKSLSIDQPDTKSLIALHALKIQQGYQGPVSSPSDPYIYDALYDATKAIYGPDFNSQLVLNDRSTITSLVVADNTCYVTGYDGSMSAWNWDSQKNHLGKQQETFRTKPVLANAKSNTARVYESFFNNDLVLSPDRQWAALANEDENSVFLYQLSNKKENQLKGHTTKISSLAFAPNNQSVYAASLGGTVLSWNTNTLVSMPFHQQKSAIRAIGMLPNGQLLMLDDEGKITQKSTSQNTAPSTLFSDPASDIGTSLAVSADGRYVAAGFASGKMILLDLSAPSIGPTYLYGHKGVVKDLTFSQDGQFLASVSLDGQVLLRNLQALDNKPREMQDDQEFAHSIAFSPNSSHLLVSNQGKVRAYPVDMEWMARNLCERLKRKKFTQAEWEKYGIKNMNYESIQDICE